MGVLSYTMQLGFDCATNMIRIMEQRVYFMNLVIAWLIRYLLTLYQYLNINGNPGNVPNLASAIGLTGVVSGCAEVSIGVRANDDLAVEVVLFLHEKRVLRVVVLDDGSEPDERGGKRS